MPSKQKTLLFFSAFVASVGSFALICTSLGTREWVSSNVRFTGGNISGLVIITHGLFQGNHEKVVTEGIGLGSTKTPFQVFQKLADSSSIKVVQTMIIVFLVGGLLCSFLSSGITCLNSVSNPYLTYLGPLGVYIWASINGIFILLSIVLCAVNTEINEMSKYLAKVMDTSGDVFSKTQNTYGYSFWLLLLCILLNIVTIGIIYYYQHVRYSKKKEQERPMENASKDVILF
ncbi:hypothetical protein FKM82_014593 [Ascaphus truei]|uniref:clarin-3 n=1 Tax=Ascaphus truei TaxID=8439 RepID=UPI003F5A370A